MTDYIVSLLIDCIVVACIYTLIAIGFSLLFGVLDIIHFAHGDVSLISPFVSLGLIGLVTGWFGGAGSWATLGAIVVAVLCVGVIGVLIYVLIVKPFQNSSQLIVLVATVMLGIVIRQLERHVVPQGSTAHAFPDVLSATAFSIGNSPVSYFVVISIVTTLVVLVGISLLLDKTLAGTQIRALAQDAEVAKLMGINSTRVAFLTFFLASAVGAVGGIFFAVYTGAIRFDYGILASLLGFSAAVVGGLGSVYGAVIGGVILSLVQTMAQVWLPSGSAYQQAIAFLVVIAFLVFRPTGILGEKVVEKV